ncbi:TPA: hypothetical protein DDW35_14050 [Candidatus Sumerlaeota bacterium]|nr:hypothetical protein [Candidatus Sumerlaeota bacterium]
MARLLAQRVFSKTKHDHALKTPRLSSQLLGKIERGIAIGLQSKKRTSPVFFVHFVFFMVIFFRMR